MEEKFEEDMVELATRLKIIETVLTELKKLDKKGQRDVLAYAALELGIEEPIIRHDKLVEKTEIK